MNTVEITNQAKLILRDWDNFFNANEQAWRLAIAELALTSAGIDLNDLVQTNKEVPLDCCDHVYESACDCCTSECVRCNAD